MKKILFILLLFTGFLHAQTYPVNPSPFGKIAIKNNGVSSSTTKINTQEADGQINYIDAANLPVPTTVTNALELKTTVSAGAVSGFGLTNNGNGTVNIASGIAYLRSTNDPYANIIKYPISAVTNLALTDNANNYVLVDYNGGSPTITVTTNGSTINTQTNSIAYVIARVGSDLEYLNLVGQNVDPNAKIRIRFLNQEGIRRASGAILGFSNRNLTLTSGVLFSGLIRVNSTAFNTASPDTFTLAYNNGSVWTRTTAQTQVNNTQYNASGVLTTMPNNDYRTDYVYLLPNNPSKLYVIMGTATYNSLTLAKGAPRPSSLPVELQVLGLEVGRLFIQKNSAAIAEVQSSFANDFVGAGVPEHNSLSGLQGGTAGEYNHLTNTQVALVNGSEQTTNKATNFSIVNNTLYPTVQATKTYADGLVVGLLNDRGSYDASSNLYPSTGGSGSGGSILKGNIWSITVPGTLGGVAVGVGDWIRALVNSPGQTSSNWAVVEGNFGYVPANDADVIHKTGNETFTGLKEATNTGTATSNGFRLVNSGTGSAASIVGFNTSTGRWLAGTNQSSGTLYFANSTVGSSGLLYEGQNVGIRSFGVTKEGLIFTATPLVTTPFSGYFGESGSDGNIRKKTLANVQGEIVTTAAVDAAKPNIALTVSPIFTGAPEAPTPTTGNGIANKDYVDSAITPNGVITTSTNITNSTLTDSSLSQNGKTLLIQNGASNINYTVNGSITASFVKGGSGTITFVQGSGRTMVAANGTLVFNGAQYSTASVVSFGTTDVVYINNF